MPKKKLLRFVPFLVGLLCGAALMWIRGHMDEFLKDSFQIALAAGLGLYAMVLLGGIGMVWALAAIFWRCPHCRRVISLNFSGAYCGACGTKIEEAGHER